MQTFVKGLSRFSLALLILGIVLVASNASQFVTSFRPPVSFQELLDGVAVRAGSHIEGELVACFPPFAAETTTQDNDVTKERNFYLVPTEAGYLGLKALAMQTYVFDALALQTEAYLSDGNAITSTISVEGVVRPLKGELADYFRDYLRDIDYSDEEIAAMGTPMYIDVIDFTVYRVLFNGGFVLIALAALLISRRARKLTRLEQEAAQQSSAPEIGSIS